MNLSYMQSLDFSSWFNCYQQQALMLNERRLIVLVGDNAWSNSILKSIDSADEKNSSDSKWLIYGDSDNIEANIAKQRFRDKLGSESNFVIFQDPDLSIDAFACLSGTLVAGGIFFLLINDRSQIAESLFYQRFFDLLKSFPEHVIIEKTNLYYLLCYQRKQRIIHLNVMTLYYPIIVLLKNKYLPLIQL